METKTITKKAIEVLKKHAEVETAYLYGSQARGDATTQSDIDIALLLKDDYKPNPRYETNISLKFDKILKKETEARILNNKNLIFQHQVLKYGIPIYKKNEKQRIRFETNTYSRYLDIKPHHQEYDRIRRKRLLA